MRKETKKTAGSDELVRRAAQSALQKKAARVVIIDLGAESAIADRILLCEGENEVHTRAIAQAVIADLKERDDTLWNQEGMEEGRWILLDYVDVIVSVMLPELRAYYGLDDLWKEYPRENVADG